VPATDGEPLGGVEPLFLNEIPGEPWTIHLELEFAARQVDASRLQAGLDQSLALHPRCARALRGTTSLAGASWESHRPRPSFSEWTCVDDDMLDRTRSALANYRFDVEGGETAHLALVHAPGRDVLILMTHHLATDAVGSLRLLTTVADVYAGRVPFPDPGPAEVLEALRQEGLGREDDVARRLADVAGQTRLAGRLAPVPGGDEEGGMVNFSLSRAATERINATLHRRYFVNELLVAALHLTLGEWNAARGRRHRRLGVYVPVNLRPLALRDRIVGNLAVAVPVYSTDVSRRRPEAFLAEVADEIRTRCRRSRLWPSFLALYDRGDLPTWAKVQAAQTAVLSNLGTAVRLDFGDLGEPTRLWGTPPCVSPVGVAIGVVAHHSALSFGLRHRGTTLSRAAALELAASYRDQIDRLVAVVGGSDGA
jgi:hypothetical protein